MFIKWKPQVGVANCFKTKKGVPRSCRDWNSGLFPGFVKDSQSKFTKIVAIDPAASTKISGIFNCPDNKMLNGVTFLVARYFETGRYREI